MIKTVYWCCPLGLFFIFFFRCITTSLILVILMLFYYYLILLRLLQCQWCHLYPPVVTSLAVSGNLSDNYKFQTCHLRTSQARVAHHYSSYLKKRYFFQLIMLQISFQYNIYLFMTTSYF